MICRQSTCPGGGCVIPLLPTVGTGIQTKAKKLIVNAEHKNWWTCKWLSVKSLLSFDKGVIMYKILYDICSESFAINSLKDPRIQNMKPETVGTYKFPKFKLEYAEQRFYFPGVKNWNKIPDEVCEKESIFCFNINFNSSCIQINTKWLNVYYIAIKPLLCISLNIVFVIDKVCFFKGIQNHSTVASGSLWFPTQFAANRPIYFVSTGVAGDFVRAYTLVCSVEWTSSTEFVSEDS